jgi:MFS family permease
MLVSCLFPCGLSQVALIAYFTHLCAFNGAALHYAVLSSFASFVRVSFSTLSGWMADHYAWPQFYAIVCVSCLPSIILLILGMKHFSRLTDEKTITEDRKLVTGEI